MTVTAFPQGVRVYTESGITHAQIVVGSSQTPSRGGMSRYDLNFVQGADFNTAFIYQIVPGSNYNLSGCQGTCFIQSPDKVSTYLVFASGTNAGSGTLSIDFPNSKVSLSTTSQVTGSLNWSGTAIYDLRLISGATVYKPVGGYSFLTLEVTK